MKITANKVVNKVKHANARGLTAQQVDSTLDVAQSLLGEPWDNMDPVQRGEWKADAYKVLTERGNNWINTDMSHEAFATELQGLVKSCEKEIVKNMVKRENQEAAMSSILINKIVIPKNLGVNKVKINNSVNQEVAAAKEENTQEENKQMTVAELTNTLILEGVEPEKAYAMAMDVAKQKAAGEETVVTETKVKSVKPWFEKAVEGLTVPRPTALIGQLAIVRVKSKDDAEKAAITAEIEKIADKEKGDKYFDKLMNGYIMETKGWKIDEKTGKVAGMIYSTGDLTEKSVSGTMKVMGKGLSWAGEGLQNNADKAGSAARKPLDVIGNMTSGINKKEKESK